MRYIFIELNNDCVKNKHLNLNRYPQFRLFTFKCQIYYRNEALINACVIWATNQDEQTVLHLRYT